MDFFELEGLRYLIKYPRNFESEAKHPTILFLHGAGTRGNDINAILDNPFFEEIEKRVDFPFVVVAPLCSENSWFDMMERLKRLVLRVTTLKFVDADRLYVMGASMGGYATWQLAMSMPEYFAAIVPICGGGMYWNASRLKSLPVWAFHGECDRAVYAEESIKMVEKINAKGGNARLTIYPNTDHNSWSPTYENDEVYDFLLSHTRSRNSTFVEEIKGSKQYG